MKHTIIPRTAINYKKKQQLFYYFLLLLSNIKLTFKIMNNKDPSIQYFPIKIVTQELQCDNARL